MAFFKKISKLTWKLRSAKERNFDRTFVLFGKGSSGKSSLGNLLLGGSPFKEHEMPEAYGLTVKVHTSETQIEASEVYDINGSYDEMLKIQVIDQPGFNDHSFNQENHCKFLETCIRIAKAEMSATFLILIDLDGSFFSIEELLTLLNLDEIMSDSCYSFFPNAIIVFTHADKIDINLEKFNLYRILNEKLSSEAFNCVLELLNLVELRHIFIDGAEKCKSNRIDILKKLFDLSRPSLNVYVTGNNGFKSDEFKEMFGENKYTYSFERQSYKYDVEYNFNPDINLFKANEQKYLDEDITEALEKLRGITKGISAMVLLISLEEIFSQEIFKLITNLPITYNLGKEFRKDFWDYACIVFKSPDDTKESVARSIEKNALLSALVIKAKSRYTWVTKKITSDDCSQRLTDLVRKVKQDTEGISYTNDVVLAEMKQKIKGAGRLKRDSSLRRMGDEIKDRHLREEIPFYRSEDAGSKVRVACNDFFWDKDTISPLIGYYLLKNMNPDVAEQFQGLYPDEDAKIPTEIYTQFALKAMRKL